MSNYCSLYLPVKQSLFLIFFALDNSFAGSLESLIRSSYSYLEEITCSCYQGLIKGNTSWEARNISVPGDLIQQLLIVFVLSVGHHISSEFFRHLFVEGLKNQCRGSIDIDHTRLLAIGQIGNEMRWAIVLFFSSL